jgi:DNA repair protein RecO (recombination protein O)
MIIGNKGARLKEISTQSRLDMEKLFDGPVYLEIWIKVKSGWADNEAGPARLRLRVSRGIIGRMPSRDDDTIEFEQEVRPAGAPASSPAPSKRRAPARDTRVNGQPAFVLHSYPYKETSLIVDMFTRDFGRIGVVAKGAKRPLSKLRGRAADVPAFIGVVFRQAGTAHPDRRRMGRRHAADREERAAVRLLPERTAGQAAGARRPHPALFDHYVSTLNELAHGEPAPIALRKFERALLKETGVAADLTRCSATRAPVEPGGDYVVDPERGARVAQVRAKPGRSSRARP